MFNEVLCKVISLRLGVLKAMRMLLVVFSVVIPCIHGSKMAMIVSSETSVNT